MKNLPLLFALLMTSILTAQNDSCFAIAPTILHETCEMANDGYIRVFVGDTSHDPNIYDYTWSNGTSGTNQVTMLTPGEYSVTITDSTGCSIVFPTPNPATAPLLIPDIGGGFLSLPIEVTQFADDDLLTYDDIVEVCVNMEHSWARDLEIRLISPNGQLVRLHNFPEASGGQAFMGEPIDGDDDSPTPGIGYEYCWRDDAQFPTMLELLQKNFATLPEGTYTSYEPLWELAGNPKNGTWTIEIEDFWNNDNGFVFDWTLKINGGDIHYLSVLESDDDCQECEEYFCLEWLRNKISETEYFNVWRKGTWNGKTIFFQYNDNAADNGFGKYYDCQGNLIQEYTGGWGETHTPNPPLLVYDDIEDIEIIFAPHDSDNNVALPDCDQVLALQDIAITHIDCYGQTTGEVCISAIGGLPPYDFTLTASNGDTFEGDCINHLAADTYTLVTNDLNGATLAPTQVVIEQPADIEINIETAINEENECMPFINIVGGLPPYLIDWTYIDSTNSIQVQVIDDNGCQQTASNSCQSPSNITSIEALQALAVYPNPSDGIFEVDAVFTTAQTGQIRIHTLLGQTIHEQAFTGSNLQQQIDIAGSQRGVYFLEISTAQGHHLQKIIVE